MLAGRTILVVEDDAATCAMLTHRLGEEFGVTVAAAGTLQEAEMLLSDESVCIGAVILDIGMPDGDGCDLCARMRREGHKMPIIMVTASDGEEDVIRGLEAGANDYIAKPFRTNELLARLRAHLRIFESSEDAAFPVGPYIFHPAKKLLQHSVTKMRVRLTDKEVAILKYLYRSDARSVDRQKLLHEVWGYNSAVATHTLETHIYRLRMKMEDHPAKPLLLITDSQGYRLDARGGATNSPA
jgi:DNA-binding response OmpR family regulator